jgi:CHAD domain-containing protein
MKRELSSLAAPAPPHRRRHFSLPEHSLRHLDQALRSQWRRYRKDLERCQTRFSEKAVHDSRVATRRLLSLVELLQPFLSPGRVKKVRRALKRHLDTFNDLRDTHVQLLAVAKLRRAFPAAGPFHSHLLRIESRYTKVTLRNLRRIRTRRMARWVAACRRELRAERKRLSPGRASAVLLGGVNHAFERVLELRRRIVGRDEAAIHRTRVAFKKFRYMVEALRKLLPGISPRRLAALRRYQTLMGNIQDASVLLAALDAFLQQKEVKAAHGRRLRKELSRRRDRLIHIYLEAADELQKFWS